METRLHGTCVALGTCGALLLGPSGAGKSDLALRYLYLPDVGTGSARVLVADDQTVIRRDGSTLIASCPLPLQGLIEVRGVGPVAVPFAAAGARLAVIVVLDNGGDSPRLPAGDQHQDILGIRVPQVVLDPFEASAPIKLALVLRNFLPQSVDS